MNSVAKRRADHFAELWDCQLRAVGTTHNTQLRWLAPDSISHANRKTLMVLIVYPEGHEEHEGSRELGTDSSGGCIGLQHLSVPLWLCERTCRAVKLGGPVSSDWLSRRHGDAEGDGLLWVVPVTYFSYSCLSVSLWLCEKICLPFRIGFPRKQ